MKKRLHLPLMAQWYRMIEDGIKPEEYREITPYWCNRLLRQVDYNDSLKKLDIESGSRVIVENLKQRFFSGDIVAVDFKEVMFTLGYPRSEDNERHLLKDVVEITIGRGNPDWGAPDRDVFIIKFKEPCEKSSSEPTT